MPRPSADRIHVVASWWLLAVTSAMAVGLTAGAWVADAPVAAAVTTTVAVRPTAAPTSPPTTVAATVTTAPAASTTVAGPTPRPSRRVPTAVSTEKIRATSLPLRTMGVTTGVVIAALAATGFIYGRVRSRIPAVAVPRAAATAGPVVQESGSEPATTRLPPPRAIPLPPPMIEDAVSDTVIFEPPSSHQPPAVIAEPPAEETDADPS